MSQLIIMMMSPVIGIVVGWPMGLIVSRIITGHPVPMPFYGAPDLHGPTPEELV